MSPNHIRWPRAILAALIAEVALIASSFIWVAIYSYLINPGQPVAVYEQHARDSGPWVSLSIGLPIFYSAGRWLAKNAPTALVMCALVLIFDVAVLAIAARGPLPLVLVALSYVSKIAASYLGGRHARMR